MAKLSCFICNKSVTDCPENSVYSLTEQSNIAIHEFISKYFFQSLLDQPKGICGYCQERINNIDMAIIRLEKQKKILLDEMAESRKKRTQNQNESDISEKEKTNDFEYIDIPGNVKTEGDQDDHHVGEDMSMDDEEYSEEEQEESILEETTKNTPKSIEEFKPGLFECLKCDKSFESATVLKNHYRTHDLDVHICDICGKSYKSQTSLRRHTNKHPEAMIEKADFKCNLCGKYYAQQNYLKRHMKKHKSQSDGTVILEKLQYKKYNVEDRLKIFDCASSGGDFYSLGDKLGISRGTVHTWIKRGRAENIKKGGTAKLFSEKQINCIVECLEEDLSQKLSDLRKRIVEKYGSLFPTVSLTTLSRYVDGKCLRAKRHCSSEMINARENKIQRAEYVTSLVNFMSRGMQVIYIGQTNFTLMYRRIKGRPLTQTGQFKLPLSRKPTLDLLGAMSQDGIVSVSVKRGIFTAEEARDWIVKILNEWQNQGKRLSELLIVCDNEKEAKINEFKSAIESVNNSGQASFLPLAPYSSMLSPLENIWTIIQQSIRGKSIGSQTVSNSLDFFESLIEGVKTNDLTPDCCRTAIKKASEFYPNAINQQDL